MTLPLASCDDGKYLESPTEFNLDDNYNLTWSRVENARSYLLSITNAVTGASSETTSRRESISLEYLDTGDYDIRLRAVGDGTRFYDSEWSAVISLNRAYESGCRYQLINNGSEYEVSGVSASDMTELVMEDTYRGKPVTSVGKNAFRGAKNLQKIVLGKNVTSIGVGAFYSCSALRSIQIPDTVTTIEAEAFRACNALESFKMPAGVTVLSDSVFAYCKELKEIDLNNVTSIGESVFDNCTALEKFAVTDKVASIGKNAFGSASALKKVTFGSGLTEVGKFAFYGCTALDSVVFSESGNLKTIVDYAFQGTALTSVELPEGLETIGAGAFAHCKSLERVTIPESVTIVGTNAFYLTKMHNDAVAAGERLYYADRWVAGFDRTNLTKDSPDFNLSDKSDPTSDIPVYVFREDTVGIADRTFAGTKAADVTLSKNIKYVGANVFNVCPSLYRFDASNSNIEILDAGAFAYSENLVQVYLMPSDRNKAPTLKMIGEYAFFNCTALNFNTSATSNRFIPESVERIGAYAFRDSGMYKNADEYGVVYADDWVVGCTGSYEISSNGQITRPQETHKNIVFKTGENGETAVRGISDYAFFNCFDIESFENSAGIRSVGRGAFYNCRKLAGYAMSNSNLRTIDDYAFYGCESLVLSGLPRRLQSIGRSAFYGCTMLDSVEMPASLTSLGDFAYYGCTNLSSVKFGSSLTEIGDYAFYGCTNLTNLTIPGNIKRIGNSAFSGCTALEEVIFEEGVETIGAYAFRSDGALREINLPDSVKTVEDNAFLQCTGVETINLGRVENIGDFAFSEIYGVSNLCIPDSVKTIGKGAFYFLGSVVDEEGNQIGSVLRSVTIGGSVDKIGANAFYGCIYATFFVEDANREADWGTGWNSSRRPAVWGVALSEDKSYVVSVAVGENTFEYFDSLNAIGEPYREGYVFAGWSLTENGTDIAYTAQNVMKAPVGTTLYAVYIQI